MNNYEYIYLHGFASGVMSYKAQYLADLLQKNHLNLNIIDLNQGDFSHLTITKQVNQVANLIKNKQVIIIGSSLGGLTAAILGEKYPNLVKKLILLAPAFNFLDYFLPNFTINQLQYWQSNGYFKIYHYGEKKEIPLHYQFILDAEKYQNLDFNQKITTLIFHGINDEIIPIKSSYKYTKNKPWVKLIKLNSDHGLTDKIQVIGEKIINFVF